VATRAAVAGSCHCLKGAWAVPEPKGRSGATWLKYVSGAVKVAPLHRPQSSCSSRGAKANTACSLGTRRPDATRQSMPSGLIPSSSSWAREIRLNCFPANSSAAPSLIPRYSPVPGTAPPGKARRTPPHARLLSSFVGRKALFLGARGPVSWGPVGFLPDTTHEQRESDESKSVRQADV